MKGMVRLAGLSLLAVAGAAQAVLLAPGSSALLTGSPFPPGVVIDSVTRPYVGKDVFGNIKFTGHLIANVVKGPGGFLTFGYRLFNDPTSLNAIGRFTNTDFAGFLTDVDWSPGIPGGVRATLGDRDATGQVVQFSFINAPLGFGMLSPGKSTEWHYIRTNAKFYTVGNTSIIDGGIDNVKTFAPTAVPEPASILAIGAAVGALVLRRKR